MAQTRYRKNRKFYITFVILLALIALGLILHKANILFPARHPISASSYTKGEPNNPAGATGSNPSNNASNTSSGSDTSTQPGDQKSSSGGTTANNLQPPSGDFVSDHHPNLSGSPSPNSLTSVCTTTPGASCQISFSQNGITKTLPSEVADRGGSAYWSWTLQSLGITTGSWQVHAIASLNGQTATAVDPMTLEVSQ